MMAASGRKSTGVSADLRRLFGIPENRPLRPADLPDRGGEVVAFMRADQAAAARRYAKATRRRAAFYRSVDHALADPRVAVVVAPLCDLTAEALQAVAASVLDPGRDSAVGLIPTATVGGHPVDPSVFAVAYRLSLVAPPGPRTALFPWLAGEQRTAAEAGLLLTAGATPAMLAEGLLRDNALVTIGAHSDGIDLQLADGASLCGVRRWRAGEPGQVMPRCMLRLWCHRRRKPLVAAVASSEVVDPEVVRARVLLLDSCFGLPLSDRLFHRSFSLLDGLLTRALCGAVVTHTDVTLLDTDNTERVGDALCCARGIGAGLKQRASVMARRGDRPVLIGDPALVLRTGPRLTPAKPVGPVAAEGGAPLVSLADPAASMLGAMVPEIAAAGSRKATADAVLGWLLAGGRVEETWVPGIGLDPPRRGPCCAACGAITRLFAARRGRLAHGRHLIVCPVCGIVADRRSTEAVLLTEDSNGGCVLTGAFRQPVRAAGLRFEVRTSDPGGPSFGFAGQRWPVTRDGVPARSVRLASQPPGMNRITAAFVHDSDVTVLTLLDVV